MACSDKFVVGTTITTLRDDGSDQLISLELRGDRGEIVLQGQYELPVFKGCARIRKYTFRAQQQETGRQGHTAR